MRIDEIRLMDYITGYCHVMAIALKRLHPDWTIRARIGWDEYSESDEDYRIDHIYAVAPDGSAYDCRGRFDNEDLLLGPDETGGLDVQVVDFSMEDIRDSVQRHELRFYSKKDIDRAIATAKKKNIAESQSGTTLKDLATVKTNMQDADFWLVRKGSSKTVGKPVREFNPEHIGIKVTRTDVLDPQYLYYVFMNLHNQGYFAQRATGMSELVHIRTSDVADIEFSQ